jgi:MraZ protein
MEFTLVIWPKAKEGPCLRVLTPMIMEKMMQEIEAMPNSDPNKTVLKRYIGGNSAQVALDSAGRVCIPEELAKAASITNEAVLVGLMDRFEIWATDAHEKVKASDEVMAQEAFKLMQ